MMFYRIRFNKSRGQPGRGSFEHVWRVFEGEDEYIFKHLDIRVPVKSEKDLNGVDYNIVCFGHLHIDTETSTAVIRCSEKERLAQDFFSGLHKQESQVYNLCETYEESNPVSTE
jgi:hypothetical protein